MQSISWYYPVLAILLLAAEELYFRIADKCNIIDRPNERSSHTHITLRGGGIIFWVGVLLSFLFHPSQWSDYGCFFVGLTLICTISFWDDVRGVRQLPRLAVHLAAMLLLFAQWHLFGGEPWWYIVIALIFCMGTINAYNFMDGINGITGGYSLVILVAIAYANFYMLPEPVVPEVLLHTVTISVFIFCYYNFRPRARCFAGDVGSVGIAFILVYFLGSLILATHDLTYLALLLVYGVDSILTIVHRLMLHENIGLPHRKHLYQLLANELHWPHVAVSALYMAVQAVIAVGLFATPEAYRPIYFFAVLAVLCVVYICFMRRYFHLHIGK